MPDPSAADVTRLLLAWRAGDETALGTLFPLVYGELRRLAHRRMRAASPNQTLQTTALINETYLAELDDSGKVYEIQVAVPGGHADIAARGVDRHATARPERHVARQRIPRGDGRGGPNPPARAHALPHALSGNEALM